MEATSVEEAKTWVKALRALLKYGDILSPAQLLEADRIRQKKEKNEDLRRSKALKKHEQDRAKLRAARQKAHKEAAM